MLKNVFTRFIVSNKVNVREQTKSNDLFRMIIERLEGSTTDYSVVQLETRILRNRSHEDLCKLLCTVPVLKTVLQFGRTY